MIIDIFMKYKILNILFCVEIVKNFFFSLLLKAFSNHINVIFHEEVKWLSFFDIAIMWW